MAYTAADREQIDEIKQWWKEYGRVISVALVIGLLIGGGWKYWQYYRNKQASSASQIYQAMQQAVFKKQSGVVTQYAKQLQSQYGGTVYAALGGLVAAKSAVQAQQYHEAQEQLSWVAKHARQGTIQELGQVRLASVQLQLKEPAAALTTLQKIKGDTYAGLIAQTRGQAYLMLGQSAQAQAAFAKAHTAFMSLGTQSPVVALYRSPT